MTAKEKLKEMLTSRGMLDEDADKVLVEDILIIENLVPIYVIEWDRPASELPDSVYNEMWPTLYYSAKEWIAKNAPQAWYRSMFE